MKKTKMYGIDAHVSAKSRKLQTVLLAGLVSLSLSGCAGKEPVAEAGNEPAIQFEGEGTQPQVGMGNPWRDCTEEEAGGYAPNGFSAPDGAANVQWSLMEVKDDTALPGTMVQLTFDYDGVSFTAREQAVAGEEITDISGMYYDWTVTDEGVLNNWGGGNMPCRISRYAGEDEYVDVCLWFDIETGYAYSLSAQAKDLDGFDIQAAAEQIYDPAKQVGAGIPDDTDETSDEADPDAFRDYGPEIEADVKAAVDSASSIQDEIDKIQDLVAKYALTASKAETQTEMNMMSGLTFSIWDRELNSLWSRISNQADEQTKERLLADQRNWNSMKDEVKLESIGRPEDGGSMYPMSENAFYEEITFNRCCILANELAKIKGESYSMPKRSMYATYVDNQGTGNVYSTLITKTGMELDNEAVISIYRLGETEGTFSDKGNGVYEYVSYSENVKGIIRMNGWDGATFEVTECFDCPFNAGDKYEFDFAF